MMTLNSDILGEIVSCVAARNDKFALISLASSDRFFLRSCRPHMFHRIQFGRLYYETPQGTYNIKRLDFFLSNQEVANTVTELHCVGLCQPGSVDLDQLIQAFKGVSRYVFEGVDFGINPSPFFLPNNIPAHVTMRVCTNEYRVLAGLQSVDELIVDAPLYDEDALLTEFPVTHLGVQSIRNLDLSTSWSGLRSLSITVSDLDVGTVVDNLSGLAGLQRLTFRIFGGGFVNTESIVMLTHIRFHSTDESRLSSEDIGLLDSFSNCPNLLSVCVDINGTSTFCMSSLSGLSVLETRPSRFIGLGELTICLYGLHSKLSKELSITHIRHTSRCVRTVLAMIDPFDKWEKDVVWDKNWLSIGLDPREKLENPDWELIWSPDMGGRFRDTY